MRRSIILVILIVFNALFIYGISYANRIMFNNNFMIYLNKNEEDKQDDIEEEKEHEEVNTTYNGESIESIGKKMERLFTKTELQGLGEFVSRASITKSVNPYLIGGIILESTNCRIECSVLLKQCNNVGGIKGQPGCFGGSYMKYKDKEESITDLVNRISMDYASYDLQAPYKMYKSFDKNTTWAYKVNKYMEELKRG